MKISLFALILVAAHSAGAAASSETSAVLVKDIDTRRGIGHSTPMHFRRTGDTVYFSATTPATGRELYATDGTNARLVVDFAPGPQSSHASLVGLAGTRLVVEADDGAQGRQISALDPSAGTTTALMSFGTAGDTARFVQPIAQLDARAIFVVGSEQSVWGTDGTTAGTRRLFPGNMWNIAERTCTAGNTALFALSAANGGHALWRSDGSLAGTASFADLAGEWLLADTSPASAHCYFLFRRAEGWSLWRSDGNSAQVLAMQATGMPRTVAATPTGAYVVEGDGNGSVRVWRTGVGAPIATLASSGGEAHAFTVGERLVLRITVFEGGTSRDALYVSDGTAAGTHRLAMPANVTTPYGFFQGGTIGNVVVLGNSYSMLRIDPAAESVTSVARNPVLGLDGDFVSTGNAFIGPGIDVDGWGGIEVWRTDGTEAGTRELHDIWYATRDTEGLYGSQTASDREVLFFTALAQGGSESRYAVWRTDGSAAGTQALPLASIGNASVTAVQRFGDGALLGTEGAGGYGVYRSDRQFLATTALSSDRSAGLMLTTANGATALFSCGYTTFSRDLCAVRSSGGSVTKVIEDGEEQQAATPSGSIGDALLFQVGNSYSPAAQRGLWRSNGTVPGTFRLAPDIVFAGNVMGDAPHLSRAGKAYFGGYSIAEARHGLYVSDGTAAGTHRVADIPLQIRKIVPLGEDRIAFTVTNGSTAQLWISDGTAWGTDLLRTFTNTWLDSFAAVGDRVHLIAADGPNPVYLVSDGTKGGTIAVALPSQWKPLSASIVALDADTAAFSCESPSFGVELCAIDAGGTNPRLLQDIFPGPRHSGPTFLGSTSDASYFAADDGYHGREVWRITARGDAIFADAFD